MCGDECCPSGNVCCKLTASSPSFSACMQVCPF
jgi:hypothetical protein